MTNATAELILLHPGPHRRVLLGGKTMIGRSHECHVRLHDPKVDPVHGAIVCKDDHWLLQGTKGSIGFRVNDQPVTEAVLADRDVIQLGDYVFGFRKIRSDAPENAAASSPSAPTDQRLDDFDAERSSFVAEKAAWAVELERRRSALSRREEILRQRSTRAAQIVSYSQRRTQRRAEALADRAKNLDELARKLAVGYRSLEVQQRAAKVEERHLDDQFHKFQREEAAAKRRCGKLERVIAERRRELHSLEEAIGLRRSAFEAPKIGHETTHAVGRERLLDAREAELCAVARELEAAAVRIDQYLDALAQTASVANEQARVSENEPMLRLVIADDAPAAGEEEKRNATPVVDLVSWADETARRFAIDRWWNVRAAELQDEIRAWRHERGDWLARLQSDRRRLHAQREALAVQQQAFAAETAKERDALFQERESVDRRLVWLEHRQAQADAAHASLLQSRYLARHADGNDVAPLLRHLTEYQQRWSEFRAIMLRERLELLCERERSRAREQDFRRLRRLVVKQRTQLAEFFSEQRLSTLVHAEERRRQARSIAELEATVEKFAACLLDEPVPQIAKAANYRIAAA